jgi:hypothetical protein
MIETGKCDLHFALLKPPAPIEKSQDAIQPNSLSHGKFAPGLAGGGIVRTDYPSAAWSDSRFVEADDDCGYE